MTTTGGSAGVSGSPQATAPTTPPTPLGAVLIPAPSSNTSNTAARSRADSDELPPGALGVLIESMMLANVIDVDSEHSCMTLRSPDGSMRDYRMTAGNSEEIVAVGDQVVIEVLRPLFASAGDVASASPAMADGNRLPSMRAGKANASAASERSSAGSNTIISPVSKPAAVISRSAERCVTR
jgi:hypothetical protein